MFTGIICSIGKVIQILKYKDLYQWVIKSSDLLVDNLSLGASISCNGCCLTVRKINNIMVSVDIVKETLKSTNLDSIKIGQWVNLERSLKFGEEVGGHLISGHVITVGKICDKKEFSFNKELWIKLKKSYYMKYFFYKGFVGVDGISLTIISVRKDKFCVSLVPETILRTTIGKKIVGDVVNIEIDFYTQIAVDSVQRFMLNNLK